MIVMNLNGYCRKLSKQNASKNRICSQISLSNLLQQQQQQQREKQLQAMAKLLDIVCVYSNTMLIVLRLEMNEIKSVH